MKYTNFYFMGQEEFTVVKEWLKGRKAATLKQKAFLILVRKAKRVVKKFYCISEIEPSIDKDGKLYYKEGDEVMRELSCIEWRIKACEFAPEYGSDLATKYQLALWYAYRIAKGFWTIEYVCDDSSSAGNYWGSPNAAHAFEVSGAREVGGANDGTGNTCKIVIDKKGTFWKFGGAAWNFGDLQPVAANYPFISMYDSCYSSSGVVVLNKVQD